MQRWGGVGRFWISRDKMAGENLCEGTEEVALEQQTER